MTNRALTLSALLLLLFAPAMLQTAPGEAVSRTALRPGSLTVLPDDGREPYFRAIDAAKHDIRIEICVLEDPQILEHIQAALRRRVRVRVIVDRGKYDELPAVSANLTQYLTAAGGELHLSNPVFPRSFPKIILIDSRLVMYGSACLDETTFTQYRDFAQTTTDRHAMRALDRLFDNDWAYSAAVGQEPPPFNPTPPIARDDRIIAPVNASDRLVRLYQDARRTLVVYTEAVGNLTLEGELIAAAKRGVSVRLIAPATVNGAIPADQALQDTSLAALAADGVHVHVSGPDQSAAQPYMHARAAVVDGEIAYLGSISLSPDSSTVNREVGMILRQRATVLKLEAQFDADYRSRTRNL